MRFDRNNQSFCCFVQVHCPSKVDLRISLTYIDVLCIMCRSSFCFCFFSPDITIPVDWALKIFFLKLLTCVYFFIADFTRTLGSNVDSLRTIFLQTTNSLFYIKGVCCAILH